MNIIDFLLPLALLLGGTFALSFILSVRSGQLDDLETPARRMLLDDDKFLEPVKPQPPKGQRP